MLAWLSRSSSPTLRAFRPSLALLSLALCAPQAGCGDDCTDCTGDCTECGDDDDSSDATATPTPTPQDRNNATFAGDLAADFLKASPYSRLVIEIDVVEGAMPDEGAIDGLVDTIETLCNKPGGIDVRFPDDTIPASGEDNPAYSLADIKALEADYRDAWTAGDEAVLHFLFVDGHSDYDTVEAQVVGYAYRGASMAVFMGTVEKQPFLLQSQLMSVVTIHELGHVLGLVDNGTPMVEAHKDPGEHGPHCDNDQCVMYWSYNSTAVLDLLGGGVPDFDDACRADVTAAGGNPARP